MFTGLVTSLSGFLLLGFFPVLTRSPFRFHQIEHLGTVSSISRLDTTQSGGAGWSLTISDAAPILNDCHIGDSIAINGCCLTVTEFDDRSFKVGLAPETLSRTNLGDLKLGDKVALERALSAHTRFGGHFVQGHIDFTVTIASKEPDGNSLRLLFKLPTPTPTTPTTPNLNSTQPHNIPILPYIVPKGFIALDGASLTVTTVDDRERTFGVMLIAHTQNKIEIGNKQIGDRVNVEVDMVGKYVEKAVGAALAGQDDNPLKTMVEGVVEGVLKKHGLLK